jgi:hypothetical protein
MRITKRRVVFAFMPDLEEIVFFVEDLSIFVEENEGIDLLY